MPEILKSLPFVDLDTKPPLTGKLIISTDIQQTVALLVGWDGASRRLIRVSPSGALHTTSPKAGGVLNILADAGSYTYQGVDKQVSEVLVRANPDNSSRVWINIGVAASVNAGHPLDGGEWVSLAVDNLRSLHILIVANTERVSIIFGV